MLPSETATQPLRTHGNYRWWVVAMLWLVCLANYADRQALFSVFPPLQHEFGLSRLQLGVIGSVFMWTYALFGPFGGWWCDRVSRRNIIISALVFWSLCTAATAHARNYQELVLYRALGGIGESFYFPAAMSLIADYHNRYTRSRAMSLHQSAVYAGSIAGGGVSAWLAQFHGWREPFGTFGVFGFVLSFALLAALREPVRGSAETGTAPAPRTSSSFITGFLALLANPLALTLAAVFVGANFVAAIFLSWTPEYLFEKFHMSLAMAGFNGSAWLQISSILGVVFGGAVADFLVRRTRGGRMFTQAAGLFLGTPFLFLTGWTRSAAVVLLAMSGFGFAKGIYDANIWASLFEVVPVQHRGATLGLMNSLGWVGGGVGTIAIASASTRFGFGACLSGTSIIYAAFSGVLLLIGRRTSEREPVPE
jgi:predicted MFS family arabinose efflux permease